jgi:hypothetical protein
MQPTQPGNWGLPSRSARRARAIRASPRR